MLFTGLKTAWLAHLITVPIAQAESQSPPDHRYRRRCLMCDPCSRYKPSCRQTHQRILIGAALAITRHGHLYICVGQEQNHLLRCHRKHCNAVPSNQTIVLHLVRIMLDRRLYIRSNHPHWKLVESRRHLTAALRTHCMSSYISDFKVLKLPSLYALIHLMYK